MSVKPESFNPTQSQQLLNTLTAQRAAEVQSVLSQVSPKQPLVAGISGGADSVFLLHLLHQSGYKDVIVCHLHHGLRGTAADEDAQFVQTLAKQLGYLSKVAHVDLERDYPGLGVEAAGRQARRKLFAAAAAQHNAQTVCLGHHADDRAETILFNLLRGSGATGVGTLKACTIQSLAEADLQIVRPLISLRATEVRAGLEEAGMCWREDSTNYAENFTRNRLRLEGIPLLSAIMGRDIVPSLLKYAILAEAEDGWLNRQVQPLAEKEQVAVSELRELPLALQRRLLWKWLINQGVDSVGFREVELVRSLFQPEAGVAKVNLPSSRHARRKSGYVFCE